ncbi:MAG: hypothetical protein GTN64_05785 [Candidatus Latescibacteria bacterium]|nr:hypothetical protein [Candidatus Latescibacterota bacterium]NIO78118.1 hypothetical protein [Candidatus Latescibacterota bacterium]
MDINQTLLDQGCLELERYHLTDKVVTLVQSDDFDFSALGQRFQFALAQSLFTHLPLNSIISCLKKMEKALADGGQFYATFFENKEGKNNLEPIKHPSIDHIGLESYFDRDPYHYDFGTFEWICDGTSLEAKYIGDWQHPRDQKMMVFTKASPS